MRPEIEQAIQVLREKIRAKEEEANKLKRVVNSFYEDENEPAPFADLSSDSASVGQLRTDHFYGHTLAEAAKEYLEMRKSRGLGSATVNDIYKALKDGGYKFETATEEYAKNGVRISLRKNSTIFHQLPGGDYGLCIWYSVKGPAEKKHPARKKGSKHRTKATAPKTKPEQAAKPVVAAAPDAATPKTSITTASLEQFVRERNRRMKEVIAHFGTDKATVTKLLSPASKVALEGKIGGGWLKIAG